jgi:DNA-binding NtrC family response regulator
VTVTPESVSTVLVVQADSALNQDWCTAIESVGHTVISAQGISQGIQRLREGGIDVILVDHWDSHSGLADFVSELDRLPEPPPFVLISDSPRAPEISAHMGAAAFVPKPCTTEEIVEIARRFSSIPVHTEFEDESTEPRVRRFGFRPSQS